MGAELDNPYRLLPSVDEVLLDPGLAAVAAQLPRELLVTFVQEILGELRSALSRGELDGDGLARRLAAGELATRVIERAAREGRAGIVRAVNATGVVLHTGLGRAPAHPEVAAAMAEVARSYCVLEVDRESAERNQRDDRLSTLLERLTGAEAALAVNNNAGAVLLTLATFARGRETLLSRGELVEIGGSFRMPDVMESAGTRLVEVGTTNRTRIEDYRRALSADTGLLLKVHRSNFRVEGFVEEVSVGELAELGRSARIPSVYDLGSGLFDPPGHVALAGLLPGEPDLLSALASGVDAITFSGDKLLGGPQAGLVAGRRAAIGALRKNPVYRALRLDKVSLAGLERTCELILAGRGDELPARRMLCADPAELAARAQSLAAALERLPDLTVQCAPGASQPGSGSAPGIELATTVVEVRSSSRTTEALTSALRRCDPPVFVRVQRDTVLLDPRTLLDGDEEYVVRAFGAVLGQ